MRQRTRTLTAFIALSCGCLPQADAQTETPARPNIVVLMADSMAYGDLSLHGATDLRTPRIDQLAREGVRLPDFCASGAVCRPTRAALMTGLYPQRTRVEGNDDPLRNHSLGLLGSDTSLPRMLQRAGYATAMIGKWHLGSEPEMRPRAHGFDEFFGVLHAGIDYYTHRLPDGTLDLWENGDRIERDGHLTELFGARAAQTIERQRQRQPFFLYLAFNAATPPIQPPGLAPDERAQRPTRAAFAAMVEGIDRSVGLILEALERGGLADNTLVIYTHDHGGEHVFRGGGATRGIGTLWQGGIHVPCFLRWPGRLPAGAECGQTAATMDLASTVLAAAGVTPPAGHALDGIDLLPVLRGDVAAQPRTLWWRVATRNNTHEAVRRGPLKYLSDGRTEHLFDLALDPDEQRNLAAKRPDALRELRGTLRQLEAELVAERRSDLVRAQETADEMAGRLPDADPALLQARLQVAELKRMLGDVPGALAVEQTVFEARPDDAYPDAVTRNHARLRIARLDKALGDWTGARLLEEAAFADDAAMLPPGHSNLHATAGRLAQLRRQLGDLRGALALRQQVFAARAKFIPDTNLYQQEGRLQIAELQRELGNPAAAAVHEELVLDLQSDQLEDDDPRLQRTRAARAATCVALGDLDRAVELQQKVLAVHTAALPADHPSVLQAQQTLAAIRYARGEVDAAHHLLERVVAGRERFLPNDDPVLQQARLSLLGTSLALRRAGTDELLRSYLRGWRQTLLVTPRQDLAERTRLLRDPFDLCLSAALGAHQEVLGQLLVLHEAARGAPLVRGADSAALHRLRRGRAHATAAAARLARQPRRAPAQAKSLAAAVQRREAAEQRLIAEVRKAGGLASGSLSPGELAAALPARSAAASVLRFWDHAWDDDSTAPAVVSRFAALVLGRDGVVHAQVLADTAAVQRLIAQSRRALESGDDNAAATALHGLRQALADPIVARIGDVDTLYLSLDESVTLVPFEVLPDSDGQLLGETLGIRLVPSLLSLQREAADLPPEPTWVGFGGLAFDALDPGAPATLARRAGTLPDLRRGAICSEPPGAETEVDEIAAIFALAFPDAPDAAAQRVGGPHATKHALAELTRGARSVHLATDAYFAPDSIPCNVETGEVAAPVVRAEAPRRRGGHASDRLVGIALSGANLPPGRLGRRPGLATAEELRSLDLRGCELVTLSGSEISPGEGRGHITLRAALHAAGARHLLTSLWRADAKATRALLVAFYRQLWSGADPHVALWEARMTLRRQPDSKWSDWAGWVLSAR